MNLRQRNFFRRGLITLGLFAVAVSGRAYAEVGGWRVDPSRSEVVVNVFRGGALSAALHDHHFVPNITEGHFVFDPANPASIKGQVVFDANSLREIHSELKPDDQKKVLDQVRSPSVLDSAQYPQIRFDIHQLVVAPRFDPSAHQVRGELVGDLTVRGTTRAVRLPIWASWSGDQLEAEGTVALTQSEFGIKPLNKAMGAIQTKDGFTVDLHLVCTLAKALPRVK